MTANDSKSTPKKAEDATRHPLALLLAGRPQRAESSYSASKFGECQGCGGRSGSLDAEGICGVCHDAAYLAEWQAYAEQLESALRAQAEAEAVLREALASVSDQAKGAFTDAAHAARSFDPSTRRVVRSLHRIHETARAALAQAGGEG